MKKQNTFDLQVPIGVLSFYLGPACKVALEIMVTRAVLKAATNSLSCVIQAQRNAEEKHEETLCRKHAVSEDRVHHLHIAAKVHCFQKW